MDYGYMKEVSTTDESVTLTRVNIITAWHSSN
jgi:hypothetical protein